MFESTRSAAEKYRAELGKLSELQEAGAISGLTYSRAVSDLRDEFTEAGDRAEALRQSASDAFGSIVTGSNSASEAVSSLLDQFADMAAQSAFQALTRNVDFGSIGSALFGGLDGARAAGGPVTGGSSYLVGEKGPELFVPKASGHVMPNGASAQPSGGTVDVRIFVDDDGQLQGVVESISGRVAANVTSDGLSRYDSDVLPESVERIRRDPARRG